MARTPLVLVARTAEEMMTPGPVSIAKDAPLSEAVDVLATRGFSALPVIDDAGRPVGVLSQADIIRYDREHVEHATPVPDYYSRSSLAWEGDIAEAVAEVSDAPRVEEIMTPIVLSVERTAPAAVVAEKLCKHRVHRLFVVDEAGTLIGVISVLDILKHLKPGIRVTKKE